MAGAIMDMFSQHWGTPDPLLQPARFVLGGQIDLDPCSNSYAYERVSAATAIWLPEEAESFVGPQLVPGNPYSSLNGPPEESFNIKIPCPGVLKCKEVDVPGEKIHDHWQHAMRRVIAGDGLVYDWTKHKNVFVNPPYGRDKARGTSIYNWIEKCAEVGKQIPVLALIPAAVGTKHWQNIVFPMAERVCFLRGRVKFILPGKDNVSTTPSAMVLFGGDYEGVQQRFHEAFEPLGRIT